MRPGPKPMATPIRRLFGNQGKRPYNESEPTPPPGTPSCPRWLDTEARKKWKELVPQLKVMGVLSRIDKDTMARYCDSWSWWKRSRLFLMEHGDYYPVKDDKGRIKSLMLFPQVAVVNKLATQLSRLESEFGLTPSSRTTLQVQDPETAKELLKFDHYMQDVTDHRNAARSNAS